MWLKNIKYNFADINKVVCVWLFAVTTTVNAQAVGPVPEIIDEPDSGIEETYIDAFPLESTEDYNIYRKDNPQDPCDRGLDTYDYEKSWYDETQIYINSGFCEPALWFDNFFATDRVFSEGAVGTYVRWRNDLSYDEEEYFKFKMGLNLSVQLPGLEEKLRLTFESDEDEDVRDIAPGDGADTTSTLGLQLDVVEKVRSKFSVSINLSPRLRFRYRYTYPVYQDITLRLTQEVQREESIHSARTLLDIERASKQRYLLRASTEGKVSEEFDGVDWLQAFVLYKRINKRTSLSYEASVNGITEPRSQAINYRVAVRFRKNFHRNWLFYEIVPEMTWPTTLDESRATVVTEQRSKWLILFRFEVHFGNAYKKRYQDYH